MTEQEAINIIEQMRKAFHTTGENNDIIKAAVETLTAGVRERSEA